MEYVDAFIEASENNKDNKAYYIFLASILSIRLTEEENKTKYIAKFILNNIRSLFIEDIDHDNLLFLKDVVEDIDDYVLKSRIADILWIRRETKNIKYAKMAIEAFSQFDLNLENYYYSYLYLYR